jgi:RHS repeat-associated protein
MTDGSGTTYYYYDPLDRLTSKATPEGTLSYTYYATGQVETITSSNQNGISVSFTYDGLGRLSTVEDSRLPGNQTTTYTYDAASNLATAVYPNQSQSQPSSFTYDGLSTPVSSYTYQLGAVGNRTSVTEGTGRTANWTYDKIYRLTNETIGADPANKDGSVSYVLDPVGNRKSSTSTLSGVNPESFTFTADDELTTDNYDNNGNTTGSGVNSFTYDSENELKTMNGGAVTLLYDGDGNRVAKTVGSVTTRYLIDDLNPTGLPQVVEETVNGAVTRQYTYGLQLISENQLVSNTWTASFYETDGTGSVRQLTNSLGQVTDTYEYDAFGNTISKTTLPTGATPTPNNYLYRGEQFDPDLSLYYLRARYYNATTGRFLSSDPLAGDGERRYEYADADPVNGMDPTGDAAMIEFELINMRGFMSVSFPSWCDEIEPILGPIAGLLPFCQSPPPPCPKCFAQLKYRAVDNRWAEKIHATHSFWYVQDSEGEQFTVSGGPWPQNCGEPQCKLHEWVTTYPNSSPDALSHAGTWWSDGPSASICPQVDALLDAARNFPNDVFTYHFYGPNSNTSAHYVGNAGGFHPSAPPVAIGW